MPLVDFDSLAIAYCQAIWIVGLTQLVMTTFPFRQHRQHL
jgi:hypothetical protein